MEVFCFLCQQDFKSSGIMKHLKSCAIKNAGYADAKDDENVCYLIHIRDRYDINYSLYLMVDECVQLNELDTYLRNIWLECCGHLSHFQIHGEYYESYAESSWENDMEEEVGNLFYPKLKLTYEYDFGSTTYLDIKVEGAFKSTGGEKGIRLIARNKAPKYKCCNCTQKAEFHYVDYNEDDSGVVCSECRKDMESKGGEIYFSELVNSPRIGVCGYDGPSDDIPFMPHAPKKQKGNRKKAKDTGIHNDIYADAEQGTDPDQLQEEALRFLDDLMSRDDIDVDEMQKILLDSFNRMVRFYKNDIPLLLNKYEVSEKTYACCLSLLKKSELDMIRKNLSISRASNLKKAELIKRIESHIHQNFREILEYMSCYDFDALKEISIEDNLCLHYDDSNAISTIYPLLEKGLIFALRASAEEVELFFPLKKEFIKITSEPDFILKREKTKQIEVSIQSVLFFWGAASLDAIQSEIERRFNITDYDEQFYTDFYKVISSMSADYLKCELIENTRYYYIHLLFPFKQITSKEWQESNYPHINIDIIPEESTLEDFVMHIAHFRFLYELFYEAYKEDFIEEQETEELDEEDEEFLQEEALDTAIDIIKILLNVKPDTPLKEVFDELNLPEFFWEEKSFRDFFVELKNHTPNYWMKGNTISGKILVFDKSLGKRVLSDKKTDPVNSAASRWKTGRNDPCPCGSGKKYKVCCMNKENSK
jgi:hypothetical protein